MHPLSLIILCLILFTCFQGQFQVVGNKMKLECEKRCHSSLSAQQRANLCNQEEYSLGPAACSVMAKESLHLRYEDIYRLCKEAPSAAPVECIMQLNSKDRQDWGFTICAGAVSTVPSECFQRISSIGKALPQKKLIAAFCQSNLDHAPEFCVQSAHEQLGMKVEDAIQYCADAIGSGDASLTNPRNAVISNCINRLKDYNRNAYGIQAKDIVQFCASINPNQYFDMIQEENFDSFASAATDCFLQLIEDRTNFPTLRSLPYQAILDICRNAPISNGPTNCTLRLFEVTSKREPHLKLSPDAVISLCQGSHSSMPADCFAESKGLGNLEERALLCNSAPSTGPALCYRRSTSVFKNYPEEHRMLCVSAESEGPAECAAAAPHYLIAEEKVHLCTNSPVSEYSSPIKCLQAVHTYSKNFQNAPKRALGYFQENLQLDTEWTSRALLVSMCSFSDSQDPLAAAECYKSVPTSLHHDDAVRLCTNISSSQSIQHIQLCQRILPKTWSSEAISYLCEGLTSRTQTESIVKCAVDLAKVSSSSKNKVLDALSIAKLCRTETGTSNDVVKCVQRLFSLPASATALLLQQHSQADELETLSKVSSASNNNKQTLKSIESHQKSILHLCSSVTSTKPADCVHDMAKMLTSQVSFAPNMTEKICLRQDYSSILTCLSHIKHKRLLDSNDVLKCSETKRELKSLQVSRIYSWEDDSLEIMAGKRFSLWFDVFDQWNQKYLDEENAQEKIILKISINENNAQGAILWGYRTNVTHHGALYFQSLIISQPGPIEVRISIVNSHASVNNNAHSGNNKKANDRTVAIFKLQVKEDPVAKETAPCLYVLRDAVCPIDFSAIDHEASFPITRTFASHQPAFFQANSHKGGNYYYLHNLYCAGEKLARWGIKSYISASGGLHAEYRIGIDSIWTGIGLPRFEMSPEQKIGLQLPADLAPYYYEFSFEDTPRDFSLVPAAVQKNVNRLLKRAYYRSSLQWHPDRWSGVGLETYKPIVQGIFQQVTEAYDLCVLRWQQRIAAGKVESPTLEETPIYE